MRCRRFSARAGSASVQLQVQEIVVPVPRVIPQEIVRQVPVPQVPTVEKIVEAPQVQTACLPHAIRLIRRPASSHSLDSQSPPIFHPASSHSLDSQSPPLQYFIFLLVPFAGKHNRPPPNSSSLGSLSYFRAAVGSTTIESRRTAAAQWCPLGRRLLALLLMCLLTSY